MLEVLLPVLLTSAAAALHVMLQLDQGSAAASAAADGWLDLGHSQDLLLAWLVLQQQQKLQRHCYVQHWLAAAGCST
jgi:hypothetical protein